MTFLVHAECVDGHAKQRRSYRHHHAADLRTGSVRGPFGHRDLPSPDQQLTAGMLVFAAVGVVILVSLMGVAISDALNTGELVAVGDAGSAVIPFEQLILFCLVLGSIIAALAVRTPTSRGSRSNSDQIVSGCGARR